MEVCCKAYNAECLSCVAGQTVADYCKENPQIVGCEQRPPRVCCLAMTASCLACAADLPIEEYCEANPSIAGCEKQMFSKLLFDHSIVAMIFIFALIGLSAYAVRKYVVKN